MKINFKKLFSNTISQGILNTLVTLIEYPPRNSKKNTLQPTLKKYIYVIDIAKS